MTCDDFLVVSTIPRMMPVLVGCGRERLDVGEDVHHAGVASAGPALLVLPGTVSVLWL
jgi:hypothetical protein